MQNEIYSKSRSKPNRPAMIVERKKSQKGLGKSEEICCRAVKDAKESKREVSKRRRGRLLRGFSGCHWPIIRNHPGSCHPQDSIRLESFLHSHTPSTSWSRPRVGFSLGQRWLSTPLARSLVSWSPAAWHRRRWLKPWWLRTLPWQSARVVRFAG